MGIWLGSEYATGISFLLFYFMICCYNPFLIFPSENKTSLSFTCYYRKDVFPNKFVDRNFNNEICKLNFKFEILIYVLH